MLLTLALVLPVSPPSPLPSSQQIDALMQQWEALETERSALESA